MRPRLTSLMAAAVLGMVAAQEAASGYPQRGQTPTLNLKRRNRPAVDPALADEIAAHNAAVDRRKAEKKGRRLAPKGGEHG